MRSPRTTRLGRFLRGQRPDRNPLRRPVDRTETALVAALLAGFCAGAPMLGWMAADVVHHSAAQAMRAQQASYHQLPAVLTEPAVNSDYPGAYTSEASARWTAP